MISAHIKHVEGEDLPLLARPEAGDSTLYRSEVSAARIAVYDEMGADPNLDLLLDSLGVTAKPLLVTLDPDGATDQVMFATLQTDGTWAKSGGYTFACTLRDSELHLEGGHTYRVEVELDAGHAAPAWPQKADYGTLLFVWFVSVVPVSVA